MDGAFVDGSGCIQCVVDAGGSHWCVYGITRTDKIHYFWVGDIYGTPDDATLHLQRVTDTTSNSDIDWKQGSAKEGGKDVREPEGDGEPESDGEPEGVSKLRLVGNDIVWSDNSKWTKVVFSPAQVRLIMQSPPNSLSLVGLFVFICKKIYAAITGKV